MKCTYCGKVIQDLDTFCPRCGKRLVYRNNNTNDNRELTYLGNSDKDFVNESTYAGSYEEEEFENRYQRKKNQPFEETYLGNYDDDMTLESDLKRNTSLHMNPPEGSEGVRSFDDEMTIADKMEYRKDIHHLDPGNEKMIADKALNYKWISVLIIIVILIAAGGTGITYSLLHRELPEKTISLTKIDGVDSSEVIDEEGVLIIGELDEKALTFQVEPEDNTDTLKYSSSDESIITIEKTGKYTAQLKGIESESDQDRNATITVTVYDKKKEKVSDETIDVRVFSEKQYVSSIQDVDSTGSVYVGDTLEIHPSVEPEDAYNKDLVFISSDESVATIEAFKDESGDWYCKVKGVEPGESTIKVRSNDRSNEADDVFVEMIVTVKPKPEKKESSKKDKSSESTTDSESDSNSSSSESRDSSSGYSSGSSGGSSYSGSSNSSSGGSSSYSGNRYSGSGGSSSGSSGSSSGSSGNSSGSGGSSSGTSGGSTGGGSGSSNINPNDNPYDGVNND